MTKMENNLKLLRENSGLKGVEVARALGINPQTYYQIETERMPCSRDLMGRIMQYIVIYSNFVKEEVKPDFRILKEYRKQLDLFADQVAADLGISSGHYSFIEQGRRKPSQELTKKIVTYFNRKGIFLLEDDFFPAREPIRDDLEYKVVETPEDNLIEKERLDWLSNELKEITTPRKMEIFDLYLDENNLARVAKQLNISRERVRQVVSPILIKLQVHLNRHKKYFGEI